jgi:WD40 repeat protein
MNRARWIIGTFLLLAIGPNPCHAQTGTSVPARPIAVDLTKHAQPVSYAREVSAILEGKCIGCHNSTLAEGRLNMEDVAGILRGGKRGPAILRGQSDKSLLFTMSAHRVEPVMPPKDKPANPPLTPHELGTLKLWIDAGASDDSTADEPPAAKSIELGNLPPGIHPINAVDMTADGSRVAAGRANLVQVYDIDSGLPIVSLGGHRDLIQSVRYSPDGSLLAAGSYQIVTVWNAPTGRAVATLAGHTGKVLAVCYDADHLFAYSGGEDQTIRVWQLADGKLLATFPQPVAVSAVAALKAGQGLLAGGTDGVIRWLAAGDGHELQIFKGHKGAINDLAVISQSAGVVTFASVSDDGTARIWTTGVKSEDKPAAQKAALAAPKSLTLTGHKGPVRALAVSTDGQRLITGGDDGTIRVWNMQQPDSSIVLNVGHTKPILALALSPDGKSLLSGSADGTARLSAIDTGKPIFTLNSHATAVRSVSFSPGGDRLVTAGDEGGLKVWDARTGQGIIAFGHTAPRPRPVQPVTKVVFTGDGQLLSASADSTLKTWSFTGSWSLHKTLGPHIFRVLALDFSPDGKLLATGGGEPSRSGEIKIWEVGKGLLGRANDSLHSDTVFSLKFSPDGTKLASASADKFLKVSNVTDGTVLRSFEGHTHHVLAVDWKSDGKQLVSGGADNVLKLWDYDLGEQLKTLTAAGKQVSAVRWVPGKAEIAGACGDALVRIWSPGSGSVLSSLTGPSDYVFSVATSIDGKRIAAGGSDGVLFVWNGVTGQVLRKLEPAGVSLPATAARR